MKKGLGLLLLVAYLAPVYGGTIYVPVTNDFATDGRLDMIQVLLSNTDEVGGRGFKTLLLASGSNGTLRDAINPVPSQVAAGTTVLLNVEPATNGTGLLEIEAEDELVIGARVVVSGFDGGPPSSFPFPAISSRNLFAPGQPAHLLGLERNLDGIRTNVGIVNLGHKNGNCTVRVFRADSSPVQNPVSLAFDPLSIRLFSDAFAILQEDEAVDARIEVLCDQPFYAFATIVSTDLEVARVIRPSTSGGSDLEIPQDKPDPVELNLPGRFFTARKGDSILTIPLALEPEVPYKKISVGFTFFLKEWHTDLFHSVVGLRRRGRPLYYSLFLRGDNQKTILDLGDHTTIKQAGDWKTKRNYRVEIEYNVETESISLRAFHRGNLVETVNGTISHTDLRDNGNKLDLIFGVSKVFDNAYFPPWGWEFFDLEVVAQP